jgi:uncharacterized membrane protein YedE/YeeE
MSELDLLNIARTATANEVSMFMQLITITFAMIVAIYYFLSGARLAIKIFAFVAYMVGMLVLVGQMLIESNLKDQVFMTLHAQPNLSPVTQRYLGVSESWLGVTTSILFNGAFWILALGIFYLLFIWKKAAEARH